MARSPAVLPELFRPLAPYRSSASARRKLSKATVEGNTLKCRTIVRVDHSVASMAEITYNDGLELDTVNVLFEIHETLGEPLVRIVVHDNNGVIHQRLLVAALAAQLSATAVDKSSVRADPWPPSCVRPGEKVMLYAFGTDPWTEARWLAGHGDSAHCRAT